MTTIPITITFISIYAIALLVLTGWIGLMRGKMGILRGHGQDAVLEKRIRFHGNLIENAPAMALVLGASESLGISDWILWLAVCSFGVGRILFFKLYDKEVRALAMSLTQFPAALLAFWCLFTVYSM
ncbi:MAG: MAPEG family protein [Sulfitobacter sp.]